VLVEGVIAFLSVYATACIRFRTPVRQLNLLETQFGPLWPRAPCSPCSSCLAFWPWGFTAPASVPGRSACRYAWGRRW